MVSVGLVWALRLYSWPVVTSHGACAANQLVQGPRSFKFAVMSKTALMLVFFEVTLFSRATVVVGSWTRLCAFYSCKPR